MQRSRTSSVSLLLLAALLPVAARAQAPRDEKRPPGPKTTLVVKAAHLIDGRSDEPRGPAAVLVLDDKIAAVGTPEQIAAMARADAKVIDLGEAWLLPGLIDAHTHVLLHGDITAEDYDKQLLKESIPYRAIRATAAVRTSLWNGFTTLRDLESEGAMYADVDVKTAIARGVIPGPRLYVSTRSLAPTGMYPLLGYSWELKMPEGVQIADGPQGLRLSVREQVKYGADWIKYYSDRKYYRGKDSSRPVRSWVNYSDEEAHAIVSEAHRIGKKVAAHAIGWDGIDSALRAGVDSIEHGDGLTDDLLERMADKGVYWCPTIFVGVYVAEGRGGLWGDLPRLEEEAFRRALKKGVKIAYGTDAGGYDWSINQAKELSYMVRYGMSPMAAIRSATSVAAALLDPLCAAGAAECERSNVGAVEAGRFADLIAVEKSPLQDIGELERVRFVMKGGAVFRDELQRK
jgi:imidazolonepropionase-like amidohydrolase